jgi:hypothetical protein
MRPELYALLGIVVSVIGSVLVAKLSDRATARSAAIQDELGGAQLALRIANRADRKANHAERRLDSYDRWRREVTDEWWPEHRTNFDRPVVQELRRLDPAAVIPDVPEMPRYVPPVFDPEVNDEQD